MIRLSLFSALPSIEGRVMPLKMGERLSHLNAIEICESLSSKLEDEMNDEEYMKVCEMHDLPFPEDGIRLLERVVMHLEADLNRN